MLVRHLLNETADSTPITIEPHDDEWVKISTKASSGPSVSKIKSIMYTASADGYETKSKSGGTIKPANFKANGLLVRTTIEKAKALLQKSDKQDAEEAERIKANKESRVANKAASAKNDREAKKAMTAKYDELYGKGTWNRVTAKQEGGDDGYSYAVRVDGRKRVGGLHKSEVAFEKLQAVQELAKKEKLGKYAK